MLSVLSPRKTASTAPYGFPVNDDIRPAVQLADAAVASVDPSNEIFEKRIVRVAAMSLRLMTNFLKVRRQVNGVAAKIIEVFRDQNIQT